MDARRHQNGRALASNQDSPHHDAMNDNTPLDLARFLKRADVYARRVGRARSSVSLALFNDGRRLDEIHSGGDIGIRRMAQATATLAMLEAEVLINGVKQKRGARKG